MDTNSISIAAAGDILITRRIPEENPGVMPIREFMGRAHIKLANLETTITDGGCFPSAYSGGTWLTSSRGCLEDLHLYGFDMLALANNHTMDYSYDGLSMTVKNLEESGFAHAGTGNNLYEASRPVMIETPCGRVGIIDICSTFENAARAGIQSERQPGRPGLNPLRVNNRYRITREHGELLKKLAVATGINDLREKHRAQGFLAPLPEGTLEFGTSLFELVETEGEEGRISDPDPRDLERTVNSIREALFSCQAVIVMVHSHEIKKDQEHEADYFLETFSRACIDAGASAVVGSGTHQIKGIEMYKGCPIFYSLGNFMFENEYVSLLPPDYMEKYGLPAHASAAEGIAKRSSQAAHSLYETKEVYQSLIPYFEIRDGVCSHIELLPIELGLSRAAWEKNLPYPAEEKEAREILKYLNMACEPYQTKWEYKNGRFYLL